jgi:2,3-bisphosphoglycerate-independent phosphoglycerate mutase
LSHSVLFLFLDGFGLAPAGPDNPLSSVPMPHLEGLLGGPLVLETVARLAGSAGDGLVLRAVDACLGIPGLPQSATGQTSLFTGVNAAALLGEHVTAHPTTRLRQVIAEHSLLKSAAEAGRSVFFANAHSEQFWQMIREGKRRLAASTLTAMAAGLQIPTLDDLARGRALLWDITHEIATTHLGYQLPLLEAGKAGARLAHLAAEFDLLLFESFLPDLAGHRRIEPGWVLCRLDDFLGGLLAHRSPHTTLVLCSDHGNLEDTTTKMHTANPVPLLAVGPGAGHFRRARAITDLTPAILALLSEGHDGGTS